MFTVEKRAVSLMWETTQWKRERCQLGCQLQSMGASCFVLGVGEDSEADVQLRN